MNTTDQQAVTVAQEDRDAAIKMLEFAFRNASTRVLRDVDLDDIALCFAEQRRRLASVSSASADYVLVPREPTQDQLIAGNGMFHTGEVPLNIYRAMLAASPEPVPATNQAGEVERLRTALRFYADLSEPRAWSQPVIIDAQHPTGRRNDGPAIPSQALLEDRGEWARHALATQPATSQEGAFPVGYTNPALLARAKSNPLDTGCASVELYRYPAGDYCMPLFAATPTPPSLSEDLREALQGFVDDLTDAGRNKRDCLSINHDGLNARIKTARAALAATPTTPNLSQDLQEVLELLTNALAKVSPIETKDTADYAELTFGDHQTQAMTVRPRDWHDVAAAYLEARAALAQVKAS